MILLSDALRQMDAADVTRASKPFSITYVTANRTKRTGGEIVHKEKAFKTGLPYHCKEKEMIGIVDEQTREVTAIHNRLILQFNGESVFW